MTQNFNQEIRNSAQSLYGLVHGAREATERGQLSRSGAAREGSLEWGEVCTEA